MCELQHLTVGASSKVNFASHQRSWYKVEEMLSNINKSLHGNECASDKTKKESRPLYSSESSQSSRQELQLIGWVNDTLTTQFYNKARAVQNYQCPVAIFKALQTLELIWKIKPGQLLSVSTILQLRCQTKLARTCCWSRNYVSNKCEHFVRLSVCERINLMQGQNLCLNSLKLEHVANRNSW